jgi:hypothetical protein
MTTNCYMSLDDSPEHAAALGRLIGHWAMLETKLMQLMEKLLGIDHNKSDLVYKEFVSTISKIKLLKRLNYHFTKDDLLKCKINELLISAEHFNSKRNEFVHARWDARAYKDDSDELIKISTMPPGYTKISRPIERITPKNIQDITEDIAKLSLSFQEMLDYFSEDKTEQL